MQKNNNVSRQELELLSRIHEEQLLLSQKCGFYADHLTDPELQALLKGLSHQLNGIWNAYAEILEEESHAKTVQ